MAPRWDISLHKPLLPYDIKAIETKVKARNTNKWPQRATFLVYLAILLCKNVPTCTAFIILPCQPSIVNNFHVPFTSTKLFTSSEEPSLMLESLTTHVDYLSILDFEATCDMNRKLKPQEVIEFPTLLWKASFANMFDQE